MEKKIKQNSCARWSKKDIEFLESSWGTAQLKYIAGRLGRTPSAVAKKACLLQLGRAYSNSDYITVRQLQSILGYKAHYNRIWSNKGLPVFFKKLNKMRVGCIYIDDFWKWVDSNRDVVSFAKFEENALGAEPEWAKEKRKRDYIRSISIKDNTAPWTNVEDKKLLRMLSQNKYTCDELATEFHRTESAILNRIWILFADERPVKKDPDPMTDEEKETLCQLIKDGYSYEAMRPILNNRTTRAIKSVVYRTYTTTVLSDVRAMIGNGSWGNGKPALTVRKYSIMSNGEKREVDQLLTRLFAIMKYLVTDYREGEYNEKWQLVAED